MSAYSVRKRPDRTHLSSVSFVCASLLASSPLPAGSLIDPAETGLETEFSESGLDTDPAGLSILTINGFVVGLGGGGAELRAVMTDTGLLDTTVA